MVIFAHGSLFCHLKIAPAIKTTTMAYGSPKFDVSAEQQGDKLYSVVCELYPNGGLHKMMRYFENKLDGGAEPAYQVWDENGDRIVAHWYTDGTLTRDDSPDPAEIALEVMNPREDCVAIIAAAIFTAGVLVMTSLLLV